jgi:hypothetical protein
VYINATHSPSNGTHGEVERPPYDSLVMLPDVRKRKPMLLLIVSNDADPSG